MKYFDLRIIVILFAALTYAASAAFFPINKGMVNQATVITNSASTTTVTATGNQAYIFEGTTTETIKFPDATNLPIDWWYRLINNSTGTVSVQDGSGAALASLATKQAADFILKARANSAGTWKQMIFAGLNSSGTISGNALTADALSADPTDCTAGTFATGIAANGNLTCSAVIGAGIGDVTGPASATDGAFALFNGTTGKVIKNSWTVVPYANGGTNASTSWTQGSVFFAGASGFAEDNANLFWDDTNNRLSIGSTENTITVGGTTYGSTLALHVEGATDIAENTVHRHSDTAGLGAHFVGARSRGTEAAETVVQSGDNILRLDGVGHDGTDYEIGAQIDFEVDGTPGNNDMPGRIVFKTTPDGSATPAEAMRISQDKAITMPGTLAVTGGVTAALTGNASTASALAANPTDCSANQFANTIAANGNLTCAQPAFTDLSGTATVAQTTPSCQAISASNIDWSTGTCFTKSLSANTTFTFSNKTSGQVINVRVKNNGNYTLAWPTGVGVESVRWKGSVLPVQTTGNRTDVYSIFFDGNDVFGSVIQDF